MIAAKFTIRIGAAGLRRSLYILIGPIRAGPIMKSFVFNSHSSRTHTHLITDIKGLFL